jgi:hypothetical protein
VDWAIGLMSQVCEPNVAKIRSAYSAMQAGGDFLPSIFVLEPTSNCNVNCIMCPQSKLADSLLGEIDLATAKRVFSAISSVAELVMLYFMGEPLQHSNFRDFLSLARQNIKGSLVLSTNAMLLDEGKANDIIENQIDIVICCIDRWDRSAYEEIRRGANFTTVVANTKRLLEMRGNGQTKIIVKALDIGMPKSEADEFKAYWQARGAIPLVGWVDTWAGQFPGLANLSETKAPYTGVRRVACADLWFKMVINWEGQAVLCCHNYDYSHPLGHVQAFEDLYEIWQGDELRNLRSAHLRGMFSCTKLCSSCREWGDIQELDVYLRLNEEALSLVF